jgi:hypothetical protein
VIPFRQKFAVHLWSKIVLDVEKSTEDAVKLGLERIDTSLVNAKELGGLGGIGLPFGHSRYPV